MPKDNIERAIAKGTGEGADADQIETVVYEGYGPGGVALLIEALTDNRNRTGADVRHAFSKHGGNLGEPGSVSYLFDKRGRDRRRRLALRRGRPDRGDRRRRRGHRARRRRLRGRHRARGSRRGARRRCSEAGIEIESADVTQRPKSRVPVDEADAARLLRLIDMLEESDDVGAVHANFDVDASVLERIAG